MLNVISWNLGISVQAWAARGHSDSTKARFKQLTAMLAQCQPHVVFLQEMGQHEVGLPEAEVLQELQECAPGYSVIVTQAYVTLLLTGHFEVLAARKLQLVPNHGRQHWRVCQALLVNWSHDRTVKARLVRLANVHLVSSTRKEDGYSCALTVETRRRAVQTLATTFEHADLVIIGGDFNSTMAQMSSYDVGGYDLWGTDRDWLLVKGFQRSAHELDDSKRFKSDAHYPVAGMYALGMPAPGADAGAGDSRPMTAAPTGEQQLPAAGVQDPSPNFMEVPAVCMCMWLRKCECAYVRACMRACILACV